VTSVPRLLRILLGALVALSVMAPVASGHAVLIAADPADGALLDAAPGRILLTFNEPVPQAGSALRVIGPDGETYAGGTGSEPLAVGRTLSIGVPSDLPEGTSLYEWAIVSADGHRVRGSAVFSVGSESAVPVPTAGDEPDVRDAVAAVMRGIVFATTLMLIGLLATALLVWRPLIASGRRRDAPAAEAADRSFLGDALPIAVGTSAALALAGLLGPPLGSWTLDLPIGDYLATRQGRVDLARFGLATIASALLLWGLGRNRRTGLILAIPPVVALATLPALGGHASSANAVWVATVVDGFHVLAAGIWAGGILVLAITLPRALRAAGDARRDLLIGALRRFSRLAIIGLVVAAISGTTSALLQTGSLLDLPGTLWGRLLIVKVLIVALVVAIAPLVRRAGPSALRGLTAEAALVLLVLAVTAAMTGIAPSPARALAEPFSQEARFDGRIASVDIAPAIATEENEVHVIVVDAGGRPAVDVTDATVFLSLPERGIEDLPVELVRIETAHWTGGVIPPFAGTWEVETRLVVDEFREEVMTATMEVGEP
jgi:copper transport protein